MLELNCHSQTTNEITELGHQDSSMRTNTICPPIEIHTITYELYLPFPPHHTSSQKSNLNLATSLQKIQ